MKENSSLHNHIFFFVLIIIENDSDFTVTALATLGVYRCALIIQDGTAVINEANICDIPLWIPSIYPDEDQDGNENEEVR